MKKLILISSTVFTVLLFSSCKKEKDTIPTRNVESGKTYTAAELRSIATSTNSHRFTDEVYFKGVVIADEVSGNFYKELYVRDLSGTGAIHFTFEYSGSNLFIGDLVRLNLKGYDVEVDATTKILTIDSVNFEKNLVKYGTGDNPLPIEFKLSDGVFSSHYGDLVTIKDVSFLPSDTNVIYADPIKQLSLNRTIQDCGGAQLIVRTSNYALFALEKTPKGFGSITGIATSYNGADQMAIRTPKEVYMNGTSPCLTYVKKDFNDASITSGGWTQNSVINSSIVWTIGTFGGSYANISGFLSGNQNSENWLISPSMNFSAASNPILNFRTAGKYSGNTLQVLVSSNYTSGNPNSATWTPLSGFTLGAISPGYVWANSGTVSLNAFKGAGFSNVRLAFKYTSTTAGATNWEVDDVVIREN